MHIIILFITDRLFYFRVPTPSRGAPLENCNPVVIVVPKIHITSSVVIMYSPNIHE